SFEFGVSDLFGIWSLIFGASSGKSHIPNHKSQITNHKQIQNLNDPNSQAFRSLIFRHWYLFGIWSL
ncbi:MAG: hypothetical protein KDC19_07090, partial [Saprospiraceae bacterium]|nr:hypothetical protein [Saprospiraceae bacterium]